MGDIRIAVCTAGKNYESSHPGLRQETGLGVGGMFIREGSYIRMSKLKAMAGYSNSHTHGMAGRGRHGNATKFGPNWHKETPKEGGERS